MSYGFCEMHGPFPPEAHCPACGLRSDGTFFKSTLQEPPDTIRSFNVGSYIPEIAAIKIILETLSELSKEERLRVVQYAFAWASEQKEKP